MNDQNTNHQEPIAIIGMAGIFPQAPDVKSFWRNILAGVDAISEPVPEWEADRYLESNRIKTAFGGWLKDLYRFDPKDFGIMPNSVDGGEPDQFLALRVARDALRDAGYLRSDYDHRDTGVVLGHSTYMHRGQGNAIQHYIVLDQMVELLQAVLPSLDAAALSAARTLLEKKLPQINADVVPSHVPNVMTGRIANRLDLKGPNYLIDAACASSLLAVNAAIDELNNGRSRMMLAGGVNASLPAEVNVVFTMLGALTKRRKVRPFEAGSDGTLLGEGLGVIVLKRMSDAIADGDRIYATVLGLGKASDGKGLGMLAPSEEGQSLALERAYKTSGIDPAGIELIEAHGTGIPLGDKTEISALKKIFGVRKGPQASVAIGSVKSMISHCIPAAGIAGIIKSALALHHKILPPTLCDKVNPELGIESTTLYVNTTARPWISGAGKPRRAGVNAFGFGGINVHAILEEAPAEALRPERFSVRPAELCVFSAADDEMLAVQLKRWADFLEKDTSLAKEGKERGNTGYLINDIAAALVAEDHNGPHRMALIVKDTEELRNKIYQALTFLKENPVARWSTRNGVIYSRSPLEGKLAFMFPGEGSQYMNMFADLAIYFDEVRAWFDFWRSLYPEGPGKSRTDIIFPPPSGLTEQRRAELEKRLHDADVGSEAVFIGSQAVYSLLTSLGVHPDVMVGHSTGESSALVASGAVESGDPKQLADAIRELNKVYIRIQEEGNIHTGVLLAIGALPRKAVDEHIAALGKEIVIAVDNCSNQLVLYGDKPAIAALQERLSAAGGICVPLPFDRGYHTSHFSAMAEAFVDYYEHIGLGSPRVPLYSCASADLFPDDVPGVRKLAATQWSTTVRFRETILKMHQDGVRYFVEVGPSGNLSSFVNDILAGKEYLSIATDNRRKSSVEQFLTVLSHLYVNGKEIQIAKLFNSRHVTAADLQTGMERKQPGTRLANTMPVLHLNDADRAELRKIIHPPQPLPSGEGLHMTPSPPVGEGWGEGSGANEPIENYTPFITAITEWEERHLKAECRLAVYEDNFLRHHILSGPVSEYDPELIGLSCVPLMVSLEMMAEGCALLAGSIGVTVIENVKTFDWIALDDGELTLELNVDVTEAGRYRASLASSGTVVVSADFSFHADWRALALPELSPKRPSLFASHEIYQGNKRLFHGPIFQSLAQLDGWNDNGIDASLSTVSLRSFFNEDQTPSLVLNPVLLDAIGHLATCGTAHRVGADFNSFPSSIERIELYEPCPQNVSGLTLRARHKTLEPSDAAAETSLLWQFECIDKEGTPLFRAINVINFFSPAPHAYCQARLDPLHCSLGRPVENEGSGPLLWKLPHLPEKFCMQFGGIFLRILAHAVLSFEERNEWQELAGTVRHRREWLLGRLCIKEAVRYWIYQQTGKLLYPSDIIVSHEERGAPYVHGMWSNDLIQPPEVSLSHDRKLSIAAVTPCLHPVGVDIEHIGKIEDPDLVEQSLAHDERLSLRGSQGKALREKVLRIWCAKEAAAKYLGVGLQGRPEEFQVSFIDDQWNLATVNHTGNVVHVDITSENGMVIALAARHSA